MTDTTHVLIRPDGTAKFGNNLHVTENPEHE